MYFFGIEKMLAKKDTTCTEVNENVLKEEK